MTRSVSIEAGLVEEPLPDASAVSPDGEEASEEQALAVMEPEGAAQAEPEAPTAIAEELAAIAMGEDPEHDAEPQELAAIAMAEDPGHDAEPEEPAEESEPEEAVQVDGPASVTAPEKSPSDVDPDEPPALVEWEQPAPGEIEPDEPAAAAVEVEPAFASLSATGVTVPASSMDSLTLPERSRHEADARRYRRRRSAARLPAMVTPVDIPEDAGGRVEILVVRADPDRDEPAPGGGPPAETRDDRVRHLLTLGSGWVAVGVLAAGLIVVFVALSLVYR